MTKLTSTKVGRNRLGVGFELFFQLRKGDEGRVAMDFGEHWKLKAVVDVIDVIVAGAHGGDDGV